MIGVGVRERVRKKRVFMKLRIINSSAAKTGKAAEKQVPKIKQC
jgi:hypothetical protein